MQRLFPGVAARIKNKYEEKKIVLAKYVISLYNNICLRKQAGIAQSVAQLIRNQ